MVAMPDLTCWQCQSHANPDEVLWGAVLLPRAARRGGPVLLFSCRQCGKQNLVEKNSAGERMLSSPAAAGYRPAEADEAETYAAIRWAEANRELRIDFLARTSAVDRRKQARLSHGVRGTAPSEPTEPSCPADEQQEEATPNLSDAVDLIDAYEILGLPLTASTDEIRDRYRVLARGCHPDRVSGLDEDIRRLADRKFRRLKSAFELIRMRTSPPEPFDTRS